MAQQPDLMLDIRQEFAPSQDSSLEARCDIGTSPASGALYAAHEAGGTVPIAGIGQAGLVARNALRIEAGDGSDVAEAMVQLTFTTGSGEVAENVLFAHSVALECPGDGACFLGGILTQISHLARLPELEGLVVGMQVEVFATDATLLCRSRTHGVLNRP